jgi:hypothetical protein
MKYMDTVQKVEGTGFPVKGENWRPVMIIRLGRGRTGGTTILDVLIQWARAAGRVVVIADGDVRNSTLSGLYPPGTAGGALKPKSDDLVDMKDLLTAAIAEALERQASLAVDFGGGDRVMLEYGRELSLIKMCEEIGMAPLAVYVTGPDGDDFEHILSLWHSGIFRPKRSVLILNEHLVPNGRSPVGAFREIIGRPEMAEMAAEGLKVVVMPRLPCMTHVREAALSFLDAMAGEPSRKGTPLDPVRRFMVKQWLRRLEAGFLEVDAQDWLP